MLEVVESREKAFWDLRARSSVGDVRYYGDLVNTEDVKLIGLHRHAVGLLGELEGKRVLDCGCGYGALSCHLAKRGAQVDAVDISEESLAVARAWFEQNGVRDRVATYVASLHELPFPDESFDYVVGSCILHHLELARSGAELRRVLKPGGKAVFVENNAQNPVLMFFRDRVLAPLGRRLGSEDESPMDEAKLAALRRFFPALRRHFPEMILLRMAASHLLGDRHSARVVLQGLDSALLRLCPALGSWSYFQVLELAKEAGA